MMEHPPKAELLEELMAAAQCTYISDLHQKAFAPQVRAALEELVWDAYPLKAWNEAVCYISRQQKEFPSPAEARRFLLEFLQ